MNALTSQSSSNFSSLADKRVSAFLVWEIQAEARNSNKLRREGSCRQWKVNCQRGMMKGEIALLALSALCLSASSFELNIRELLLMSDVDLMKATYGKKG